MFCSFLVFQISVPSLMIQLFFWLGLPQTLGILQEITKLLQFKQYMEKNKWFCLSGYYNFKKLSRGSSSLFVLTTISLSLFTRARKEWIPWTVYHLDDLWVGRWYNNSPRDTPLESIICNVKIGRIRILRHRDNGTIRGSILKGWTRVEY